jgi:secreted trypsin-like serine protease
MRMVVLLAACEAIPVGSTASAIIGGQTTTADPAVVLLVASGTQGQAFCTAEIVSPHVLMTAAHCVDPNEVGNATFSVFLGSDINGSQANQSNLWIDVSATHHDSSFDPQYLDNGHDVGVAILSQAAPVVPIAMNRTPLTQAMLGQPLRLVGYGISSGNDSTGQSAGIKRVVTTPLSDYDSKFIDFGTSTQGTCEGDSGGPAFLTINGAEVIVGITSFGPYGCQGGSTDTRVDTIGVPFVDGYIQQLDPAGGATTGGGTTAGGGTTTGGGTTSGGGTTTGGGTITGGGTTTGGGNMCDANHACPSDYTCVMGQCILAPQPQLPNDPGGGGCSVGGRAAPTPYILLALLVIVWFKRQET